MSQNRKQSFLKGHNLSKIQFFTNSAAIRIKGPILKMKCRSSRYIPHSVEKQVIHSHRKIILQNQVFSNIHNKIVTFTKNFSQKRRVNFWNFNTVHQPSTSSQGLNLKHIFKKSQFSAKGGTCSSGSKMEPNCGTLARYGLISSMAPWFTFVKLPFFPPSIFEGHGKNLP